MVDDAKLLTCIQQLEDLVRLLKTSKDIMIHHHINQFFYMQKIAELKILVDQKQEVKQHLNNIDHFIQSQYNLVLVEYQRDIQWLEVKLDSLEK
jgi:hypothetical protein